VRKWEREGGGGGTEFHGGGFCCGLQDLGVGGHGCLVMDVRACGEEEGAHTICRLPASSTLFTAWIKSNQSTSGTEGEGEAGHTFTFI